MGCRVRPLLPNSYSFLTLSAAAQSATQGYLLGDTSLYSGTAERFRLKTRSWFAYSMDAAVFK